MSKKIIEPSIKRTENETSVYVSLNKLKKKASLSSLTESISKLISHQVPTRLNCLKKKRKFEMLINVSLLVKIKKIRKQGNLPTKFQHV
jgi:hypothetical protein